jgi:hypothetical protein
MRLNHLLIVVAFVAGYALTCLECAGFSTTLLPDGFQIGSLALEG